MIYSLTEVPLWKMEVYIYSNAYLYISKNPFQTKKLLFHNLIYIWV